MATTRMSSSAGEEEEEELALAAAPGFRFYPTEEELLGFYLRHRLSAAAARPQLHRVIPVVDVYAHHPSQLRSMAGEASARDAEQWFFFCPRAPERELRGGRPGRTAPSGYWKATGSPSYVFSSSSSSSSELIGVKRTMVFYHGRAPTGAKTRWKMNEYKAIAHDDPVAAAHLQPTTAPPKLRNEFSVCRVYVSTGTLRSFDRRPLNPPGAGGHGQAQVQAYQHQSVPSAAALDTNLAENSRVFSNSLIAAAAASDVLDFDMDF
ncbi:NAC domain-containing protein 90 [Brachypodium distachyon]|uniref:NAC domain-containing protein n=1 Tax=Brachypodium distachyon TaxID=15368 RepID=A0A0Q3HFE8_BRADI|nr:NAC domain-containing protein 90 [Brachypodium distachyon]KQJ92194.1 hypothetical protein BRADI_4g42180v3 [Brachypodium distachyon]|eukprot:XP_003577031.1 NAC domain-containing protein 90 [Brachypodium distachyon]